MTRERGRQSTVSAEVWTLGAARRGILGARLPPALPAVSRAGVASGGGAIHLHCRVGRSGETTILEVGNFSIVSPDTFVRTFACFVCIWADFIRVVCIIVWACFFTIGTSIARRVSGKNADRGVAASRPRARWCSQVRPQTSMPRHRIYKVIEPCTTPDTHETWWPTAWAE